ncbi:MAG: hypothetical protein ACREBJ_04220 [Nitrosotalea sp.]
MTKDELKWFKNEPYWLVRVSCLLGILMLAFIIFACLFAMACGFFWIFGVKP